MRVVTNPDKNYADDVKRRLKENNGYCPCSIVKNENTKCMCKSFREQLNRGEPGLCHCGLYLAEI